MEPTDTRNPDYYHRVVDCQWACPTHTNVPEYIRLIAQGRGTEAYLLNRESNVFPGILGRTCDRPCEPACRRGRVEEEPVAICRLKRVAADLRGDVDALLPRAPERKNGKRVLCIGAGPASLTVANDLMPLGYEVVIHEAQPRAGGLMRTNIPAFRLPAEVLEEEIDMILRMGVEVHYERRVESLAAILDAGRFDAIFIGTGAPKGRDLRIPGREAAAANVHVGIEWLESVRFGHTRSIGERVLVIGVGNTAMDCSRTSRRLGCEDVKVMARESRRHFKASRWEIDDAEEERVEILENHSPAELLVENGKLVAMRFDLVAWHPDDTGRLAETKLGETVLPCDDVILAIGQDNAFPWIERDIGIAFGERGLPVVDRTTLATTRDGVFVGGDAAFGPRNIIWAVEHGHQAAISIHLHCHGKGPRMEKSIGSGARGGAAVARTDGAMPSAAPEVRAAAAPAPAREAPTYPFAGPGPLTERPAPSIGLTSTKMGFHEWSYANDYDPGPRNRATHADLEARLVRLAVEVDLGFDPAQAAREVQRCLNCDVQTEFVARACIECDACIDICPTSCLTMTRNADEPELRGNLRAPAENLEQGLFVSSPLPQTRRVMVKDEDVCVHCGLCAERCPTAAWDMAKMDLRIPRAGQALDG